MDLKSKQFLMVAVAVVLLVLSFWFTLGLGAPGSVMIFFQAVAVALVVWVLFAYGVKAGGFFVFAAKGFVASLVMTSILWFVSRLFYVPLVSLGFVLGVFVGVFVNYVVPLSVLPVALCVVAYGVSRERVAAWLILLSSWFVLIYGVFAVYDVWWLVFIFPYITGTPYSGGAGPIALAMLLVFLAFVVACVFTGIYIAIKQPKQIPPP